MDRFIREKNSLLFVKPSDNFYITQTIVSNNFSHDLGNISTININISFLIIWINIYLHYSHKNQTQNVANSFKHKNKAAIDM